MKKLKYSKTLIVFQDSKNPGASGASKNRVGPHCAGSCCAASKNPDASGASKNTVWAPSAGSCSSSTARASAACSAKATTPARQRMIRCVGATQARGRWNTCTARPLSTCSRQLLWSLREALPRAFPRQGVWRDRPEGSRRRALWPERGANQHQRMSQSGLSSPFRPQHPAVETPPQKRTSRVTINLTKLCPLRNENADLWRRWELAPALQS